MKKVILSFALGLMLSAPVAYAKVAAYDGAAQLEAARADVENWMKYLPDDMFAAHVSMPGSHDTATGHNVFLPDWSMTQQVLLGDQIKGGIRAFDFRPGFYTEKKTIDGVSVEVAKPIICNHGSSKTDLTMEEAFTILTDYLTAHPSEFFAIHLFRGNPTSDPNAEKQALYNKAVDELFNKGKFADFFIDYDPYLTVKQMRGKIVVFRRDRLSWMRVNRAGNLGGWPGDKDLWQEGAAAVATNAQNPTLFGRVKVTDVSNPKNEDELQTKINSITNLFNSNCNQIRPNAAKAKGAYKPEWSMIFTSGEYTSRKQGYLACATHTNPLLTKLINEATVAGPTGIVFSDWVLIDSYTNEESVKNPETGKSEKQQVPYKVKGIDLVKAIWENNFKYAADYILDDELFNAENDFTKEPDVFGNDVYFMRHVETGKFLAAGADWGTHAVLADNGIRIKTFFDNRTGSYLLQTTFRQHGVDNYLGSDCYIDNSASNPLKAVKAEDGTGYYFTFNGFDDKQNPVEFALTPEKTGNTYADGATMLVNNVKFEKGNRNQLWEMISEEDLVRELAAKATKDEPVDLTFKIRGYKFDPNDDNENASWIFKNELAKSSTSYCVKTEVSGSDDWNDKNLIYRVYVNQTKDTYPDNYSWELTQDVEGLPEGFYTVSANAMVDNMPMEGEGKFEMTANGVDMTDGIHVETTGAFTCVNALGKFRDESLNRCLVKAENVEVKSDGKLNLRMAKPAKTASGKQNFFFDNFSLKYHGKTSGVGAVEAEEGITADTVVDIYTMTGVMVAKGVRYAEAFAALDNGIYIVRSANATVKVIK